MKKMLTKLMASIGISLLLVSTTATKTFAQTSGDDLRQEARSSVQTEVEAQVQSAAAVTISPTSARPEVERSRVISDPGPIVATQTISSTITNAIGTERAHLHEDARANIRVNVPLDCECKCDEELHPVTPAPGTTTPPVQPGSGAGTPVQPASIVVPALNSLVAPVPVNNAVTTTPSSLPYTGGTAPSLAVPILFALGLFGLLSLRKKMYEKLTYTALRVSLLSPATVFEKIKLSAAGAALTIVPLLQLTPRAAYAEPAKPLVSASVQVAATTAIQGKPVRVEIPSQNVDVSVVSGGYSAETDSWSIADNTANFDTSSSELNSTSGKTLLYGHNKDNVLAKAKNLSAGDVVRVYTDNGHVFEYVYQSSEIVLPTDTTVLSQLDGAPGLKLLTCDGLWSQNRRIMSFELKQVL